MEVLVIVFFFFFLRYVLLDWQKLSLLEEALHKVDSSDPANISSIIDEYSEQPYLKEQSAYQRWVLNLTFTILAWSL